MTFTVEVRTVETRPLDVRGELAGEYADWSYAFRRALLALAFEQYDAGECVACGGAVGYGISGDDEWIWLWVTLVQVGTGAVVEFLCEGCAQVLCAVGIE